MTAANQGKHGQSHWPSFQPRDLAARLPELVGVPVLVIGDVMLDEYFIGDASRVSPEAPVPVVLVSQERLLAGGAGNVARNILALGGRPHLVGACGDGHNSDRLRCTLADEGLETSLITLPGRPATTKSRILARGQQLLRIDHEDARPLSAKEIKQALEVIEAKWPEQRVVIISDYNKGMIGKRLLQGVFDIKKRHANPVSILVDPKEKHFPLYKNVDLLTPNTKETGEGAGFPIRSREDLLRAGAAILKKLRSPELLTTLGADGMALFSSKGSRQGQELEVMHIPTLARQVFDVTGAGDTVIGTLGLALAAGFRLPEACILANYAAGIVVGKTGSATASPEELKEAIETLAGPEIEYWL
jgi:rfaE bifunctional protein kinase chain/domain